MATSKHQLFLNLQLFRNLLKIEIIFNKKMLPGQPSKGKQSWQKSYNSKLSELTLQLTVLIKSERSKCSIFISNVQ